MSEEALPPSTMINELIGGVSGYWTTATCVGANVAQFQCVVQNMARLVLKAAFVIWEDEDALHHGGHNN